MRQCQLVNSTVLDESAASLFRSEQSEKRWWWRQHVPLNGNYVPIDTASYPRKLESSTLLWEHQNFTLLHTSFHSFQLHIKVSAHTNFLTWKHSSSLLFTHCMSVHIAWTCMFQWSVSHLLARFHYLQSVWVVCWKWLIVMLSYLLHNCSRK